MTPRLWMLAVLAVALPAADMDPGQRTYQLNCVQCHGADGDSLGYADILPISGINRRYSSEVIGRLTGAFSGRVFYGKDRDQLVHYMASLRGSKGFPEPGWLITPYLLERKAPRIHEFRVIDARVPEAYAQGHVTNAISVTQGPCVEEPEKTVRWLGSIGVTPETALVIYDSNGGPAAACAWWRIQRSGHEFVAVLDGGWNRWISEERVVTDAVPKIKSVEYKPLNLPGANHAPTALPEADAWDWRATLDTNGFRRYDELAALARQAKLQPGVRFAAGIPQDQLAHQVLAVHLLGHRVGYDWASSVAWVK